MRSGYMYSLTLHMCVHDHVADMIMLRLRAIGSAVTRINSFPFAEIPREPERDRPYASEHNVT